MYRDVLYADFAGAKNRQRRNRGKRQLIEAPIKVVFVAADYPDLIKLTQVE